MWWYVSEKQYSSLMTLHFFVFLSWPTIVVDHDWMYSISRGNDEPHLYCWHHGIILHKDKANL